MAAGVAGLGQALESGVQGYWGGKKQVIAERHQQAQDLYSMADRFSKYASQYADTDPQMYGLMWKAASETAAKADGLIGEKGQGAWKAVRPLFAKFIPALHQPEKDDPHGQTMQNGPQGGPPQPDRAAPELDANGQLPPLPPMAPTQAPPFPPAQQQQQSPDASSPQSVWSQVAAHPPTSPESIRQRAATAVGGFLDQYKTDEDTKNDPQFGTKLLTATLAGAKAGVDVGKMLDMKLKPAEPMMQFDESSPYYQQIQAKHPFSLPITQAVQMIKALPDATERLKNQWASLVSKHGDGTATPTEEAQFKKMQPIMRPDNVTEIEAIIGDTPPGSPEAVAKLISYHRQIAAMQHALNPGSTLRSQLQVDATTGQAFNFIFDEVSKKSWAVPYSDKEGKPVYLAKNAGLGAYIQTRHDAQGGDTSYLLMNNIRRDLVNGRLTAQDAKDIISAVPDFITPKNSFGVQVPNPDKQTAIKWINDSATGKLKDEPFEAIPEIKLPTPQQVPSGPGLLERGMNWLFPPGGRTNEAPQKPGYLPHINDDQLNKLFPEPQKQQ